MKRLFLWTNIAFGLWCFCLSGQESNPYAHSIAGTYWYGIDPCAIIPLLEDLELYTKCRQRLMSEYRDSLCLAAFSSDTSGQIDCLQARRCRFLMESIERIGIEIDRKRHELSSMLVRFRSSRDYAAQ